MESRSDHPLARAIVEYVREQNRSPASASDLQIVQGKGATPRLDGREFWLGSHRYLEERQQETPDVHERLSTLASTGHTVVVIGNYQHDCGFIALADSVRPETKVAVAELRRNGIEHVVMLTGDNHGTAEAIAKQIGITEIKAELLPAEKVQTVEEVVRDYGAVAMMGRHQ